MKASVKAVTYHLPEGELVNETLTAISPEMTAEKIVSKTGIVTRKIAAPGECASDLACQAAINMFAQGICSPDEIDYILFCSQSPDYLMPTTACLIQQRLGIPRTSGALDMNLGCSGYVYGLGLAKGLVETGQSKKLLMLTGETYSKYIRDNDTNVRTIFGDGAACSLIEAIDDTSEETIGPFIYGTDGLGANNLMVSQRGFRYLAQRNMGEVPAHSPDEDPYMHMNGPEVFLFTLLNVPKAIADLFERTGFGWDDVDLVVFHQANAYMLEHLKNKIRIPDEKFYVSMADIGNTGSSTIPIALARAEQDQRLKQGDRVMLVGFGVGYSWSATFITWQA
ncbi:3-oxoacyl-[acyl-carrier-protein] synthase 3 [Polystyrenella longa]|uniref:3-oxoacyl-[acyl-carrier-protein] synthase 3 n=1 Tax=Polystyrenella longa TaxID=2528007 RepID=A0A518CGU6_9PLAN|nr:ketoacyl-ACP synthase III [Polystyrenella longa]QDU78394.1 3-oxoacyl-[acyl-carrier-protein] synthase 3 [Polystyrenella longa]